MLFICRCSATKFLQHTSSSNKFTPILLSFSPSPFSYTQNATYVNVYMKWKKDPFYDSIQSIHGASDLKSLISLKNCIAQDPSGSIPISAVSKKGIQLDVPMKVARFMRMHPSVFEEFVGPQYNLPWFKLTPKAIEIAQEEKKVYEDYKLDLRLRLKKFIMMSREKVVPLRIIKGIQWYLGLPDGFLDDPDSNLDGLFQFVEIEDGEIGLSVCCEERLFSVLQENAMKHGVYNGGWMEPIRFPYFPPKGLRLKREISAWLDEFQSLPYVSPYEDFSHLYPDSDIAEKRVVGVLHELLCLFVNPGVERKRLFCLKKYLGLPQKFHKVFERHLNIFYLSLQNNTCTAILKEAYNGNTIERHPLAVVRKKYVRLMNESKMILKRRRQKGRVTGKNRDSDLDHADEDVVKLEECSSL